MKKRVYLDTTIPSFLFDQRPEIRNLIDFTVKWWEEESRYFGICTSEETIAELQSGNYPNKNKILDFVSDIQKLEPFAGIIDIVNEYLRNYLMPLELGGDAIHLAYASYYRIDYLLTWNCRHLANANKYQHIRLVNSKMSLFTPEIITPLQLFTEENNV